MRAALEEITQKAEELVSLRPGDGVLDIGCNDGTLLRSYRVKGLTRVGFEPAENLLSEAGRGTDRIINDYFHAGAVQSEAWKVITAIAMFYDLEDPNGFVGDLATCLHPDGVVIIQLSYLPLMLAQNAFDNICHEHLEYYSLLSLKPLLERHGLRLVKVELNGVNGGSFRVYATRADSSVGARIGPDPCLKRLLSLEAQIRLQGREIYDSFAGTVVKIREETCQFIRAEVSKGKRIYVYGASTKGNTLLQYYGLDHTIIRGAADRDPAKWGRRTIGTRIPIMAEDVARGDADYFLILPWHFLDDFIIRERTFLEQGGKFIVPLPTLRVIGASSLGTQSPGGDSAYWEKLAESLRPTA